MYLVNEDSMEMLYSSMPEGNLWGVGIVVIDSVGNNVLLEKRSDTKTWSTPGGHVDPGESPVDACIRECYEEVGVKINGKPSCYGITYTHGKEGIFTTFWFYYKLNKELVTIKRQVEEVDDIRWVPVNDVLQLDMYDVSKDAFIALLRTRPDVVYGEDVIYKLTTMEQTTDIKSPGKNGGNVNIGGEYKKKSSSGNKSGNKEFPTQLVKEAVSLMLKDFNVEVSSTSEFKYPSYEEVKDSGISFSDYAESFAKHYFAYAVDTCR